MEEATVAEVTAVVGVIQDQPEVAPLHHQGLTAVQYAQVPGQQGQALAEATVAAVPLVHHAPVQRGQAAQCGKNRAR